MHSLNVIQLMWLYKVCFLGYRASIAVPAIWIKFDRHVILQSRNTQNHCIVFETTKSISTLNLRWNLLLKWERQQSLFLDTWLTSALKMVRAAFGDMDFLLFPIADCNKHTMDIHCPLLRESPTNISLFPLSFSSISVPFHLIEHKNKQVQNQFFRREKEGKFYTRQTGGIAHMSIS